MLTALAVLRYVLQLFGFIATEVHDAEQQKVGQDRQQLKQDGADLDAIQKANQASTDAVSKYNPNGVLGLPAGKPDPNQRDQQKRSLCRSLYGDFEVFKR